MTFPISEDLSDTQPVPVGMGKYLTTFPLNKKNFYYWRFIAGFVFSFVASIGFFIFAWILATYSLSQYGPGILWKILRWPFSLGLILSFIGFLIVLIFTRKKNQSVELYESGLIFRNREGYKAWRWNDIVAVQGKVVRRSFGFDFDQFSHEYRIYNKLSQKIMINDRYCQVGTLIEEIRKAIFPQQYAAYAQAYNQGNGIVFGPLQLNKTGITVHKVIYPWENLGKGTLKEGNLVFPVYHTENTRRLSIKLEQIPNLESLVAVLKYVMKWQSD